MTRLNIGVSMLLTVAAVMLFAPTIVFWNLYGFEAVLHYWAWVAYLLVLTAVGTVLVFSSRRPVERPVPVAGQTLDRLRLGLAVYGLVAAILVIAPIVAFGKIYGFDAVIAYWGSVILLVVMTFSGLFLIFTDKGRRVVQR